MTKKKVQFYFTGAEIVEVEYYKTIDYSDLQDESDYRDITKIYRNIRTSKLYYINKGIKHYSIDITKGEIFNSKKELIDYTVNEYLEKINFYKDKIKLLWSLEKGVKK
jgi:hypothetical protein